jgi:hypothetical protein
MVRDIEATVLPSGARACLRGLRPARGEDGHGIAELGGIREAWFKDPEGNILSVVQLPAT